MTKKIKRYQHIINGLEGTAYNSKKALLFTLATREQESLDEFKRMKNCFRYQVFERWLSNKSFVELFGWNTNESNQLINKLKIIGLHVDLNGTLYHYSVKRDKNP